MRYFIEAQGFTVDSYVMNQDKLGVILLEKNGCELGSQHKKRIQVSYFLIKDNIADGEKLWNIAQWERYLKITSQNLCRDIFLGNTTHRYKGYLIIQGTCICAGDKPVNQLSPSHNNLLDVMTDIWAQSHTVMCGIQYYAVTLLTERVS